MAALGKTRSWEAFSAWCAERGLNAQPANPWTLAAYIRFLEGSMRYAALRRHIDQVGQMHFEKRRTRPDRDAQVLRVLDTVRRREDAKRRAREREREKPPPPPPLFRAEDFLDEKPPKGATAAKKTRTSRTKTAAKSTKGAKKSKSLSATPKLVRRKRV